MGRWFSFLPFFPRHLFHTSVNRFNASFSLPLHSVVVLLNYYYSRVSLHNFALVLGSIVEQPQDPHLESKNRLLSVQSFACSPCVRVDFHSGFLGFFLTPKNVPVGTGYAKLDILNPLGVNESVNACTCVCMVTCDAYHS